MPPHDPECPARMKAAAPVALSVAGVVSVVGFVLLPMPVAIICVPANLYLSFGAVVAWRFGLWRTRPDLMAHMARGGLVGAVAALVVCGLLLTVMPGPMLVLMLIPVAISWWIAWSVLMLAEGKRRKNAAHGIPERPGPGPSSGTDAAAGAQLDVERLHRAGDQA